MGRARSVRPGMFSVPKISHSIEKSGLREKIITSEPIKQISTEKATDPLEIPKIVVGSRRAGLLARLLERGKIRKSDQSFRDIQLKTVFPDLVHTEVDCLDEAELRSRFPKQGTNHKFFKSGNFKFQFLLPCDSENVVVAQILLNGKVRLPSD